ncbi:MAG: F0F1 ATP synthase subunit B [Roseiflexus sp.]|nr:F0F1 ATP synthase subunit B [Roseiflexus sp.]MCS7290683.1 F0F1 ATP synthase subunit B [Roseiflexus sp.]MDW8145433.1 F0F1 ATP synthase subunit B [Roseiflexaceae bacterium]MDW8232229.1 F0F1 ATP synthase subunit B [Roseiflexaceae bacterium]
MEKLGVNWGLLIAQLINVIFVVWLLTTFLYRPILNMLNQRTNRIQEGLQDAERVREQLANAKRDYDAELARARQEAAGILAQAQERARAQAAEIIAQAHRDAEKIKSDALAQAEQERQRILGELKDRMAELVVLTAERVLGEELKSNHDRLIEESLAELGKYN